MTARKAVLVAAILATALAGCSEAEGLISGKGEASRTAAQHGAQADDVTAKEKDCVNGGLPPGTIIPGRDQPEVPQDS